MIERIESQGTLRVTIELSRHRVAILLPAPRRMQLKNRADERLAFVWECGCCGTPSEDGVAVQLCPFHASVLAVPSEAYEI